MTRTSLLAAAIALASATPAAAQTGLDQITLGDPEQVAAALQRAGYKAQIKLDKQGDTYVASAANGDPFSVVFHDCKQGKGCTSLAFHSWWKKKDFFDNNLVNEWNSKKRFLKIAIDTDGDLNEYMDVSAMGTVSFTFFEDTIDWYVSMDGDLRNFLGDKETAAGKAKK